MGSSYNTRLSDPQEAAYQQWKSKLPENLQTENDYDLRGAFLANAQQASNGHLGDQFKKPNHITFSDESQYSTPEMPGGRWIEDGKGGFVFWASPTNLAQHSMPETQNYFDQNERGSSVIFPLNYRIPRKGTR